MQQVTFIESLNIKTLPMVGREVIYQTSIPIDRLTPIDGGESFLVTESIKTKRAPILNLSRIIDGAKEDVFIAYSEEVREALAPLKWSVDRMTELEEIETNLKLENKRLCRELEQIEKTVFRAPFFKRMKYFFSGKVKLLR